MIPIIVLISGYGSNLQAIIDQCHNKTVEIKAVISDQADAYGLTRAKDAGIPAYVCPHIKGEEREDYCAILADVVEDVADDVALVILAGFMYVLSPNFVQKYQNKILNIHPSLLPKYRGLHTHHRVLKSDDQYHGVTIHVVTEELDDGPILCQRLVPIHEDDTEEDLADRVHCQELRWYPRIINELGRGQGLLIQPSFYGEPIEMGVFLVDPKYFLG